MKTLVARIQEVLHGHSARAQIRALDADGHQLAFEVPVDAARGLTSEHVLVLTWSAHIMPAAATAAEPEYGVPATSATESVPTTGTSSDVPTGPSPGARQLANLIGLKLE